MSFLHDFTYHLPEQLIAQKPASPRDSCRLMLLDPSSGKIKHDRFFHLANYLQPGDVLVFNQSKVIPARLHVNVGGKKIELFLTRKISPNQWLCLGKPGKVLTVGTVFEFQKGGKGEVLAVYPHGQRKICVYDGEKFDRFVREEGQTPLPPYITGRDSLPEDYQTVFAQEEGSVAAPTAGLHFTRRLLDGLKHKGIQVEFVTLHVGIGTFLPVKTRRLSDHVMHGEEYSLDAGTAQRLTAAKREGRRIIAVGTTAVRVLESSFSFFVGSLRGDPSFALAPCARPFSVGSVAGEFVPGRRETTLFITPGYRWKCVDGLVTNFHLPKSTLLVLVCSFAETAQGGGREYILKAYREAVKQRYRFFSFGDALLIFRGTSGSGGGNRV